MTIIDQKVNDGLAKQYEIDGGIFKSYPSLVPFRKKILELISLAFKIVWEFAFQNAVKPEGRKPRYLAPAGAPLAGKTTILEQEVERFPERYSGAVLADPDPYATDIMVNLNRRFLMSASMIAKMPSFEAAQMQAYDVARPAANYFTNSNINEAAEKGLDIVHGTTLTGPFVHVLLGNLKKAGYEINLLLCGAEDDMRAEGAEYRAREQGNYQATPADVASKGEAFPTKMSEYFEYGDRVSVFWRAGVTENATLAATYENGERLIHDQDAFDAFTDKYDRDRAAHLERQEAKPTGERAAALPAFNRVENIYFDRFQARVPAFDVAAKPLPPEA